MPSSSNQDTNPSTKIGIIAAIVAGFYGFSQASISGQAPIVGAILFAVVGFGLGKLGYFIVRSLIALAIYGAVVFIAMLLFRERMIAFFGIDPIAFVGLQQ